MSDDLRLARFPAVPLDRGHYESFYLKASDPSRPRGAWIRYTVLKRPGQAPRGSLWTTVWTGEGPPRAYKVTLEPGELEAGPGVGEEPLIRIGSSRLGAAGASGSTDGSSWEVGFGGGSPAFPYLPRGWMYTAPVPRTKAVSLHPVATFTGEVTVGSETVTLEAWPGMVGHNWGTEHAERWIWLHGAGFADASDAWFDATIGRIRLGGLTVPWIANGGLWIDGRLHRLGGPAAIRSTHIEESPTRCRFGLGGSGLTVTGLVEAPPEAAVAWRYSDPGGGEHVTANCSVAALTLTVQGLAGSPDGTRMLRAPAGAAYELGAREAPSGIAIQPFPDP
jgi:hypothetical protein